MESPDRHIPTSEPVYVCEFGQCFGKVKPNDMYWAIYESESSEPKGIWVCRECAIDYDFLKVDTSKHNHDTLVNYLIKHKYTYGGVYLLRKGEIHETGGERIKEAQ